MKNCLITGSCGLIGSEAVEFMHDKFDNILGIDNNMRQDFFGDEASTQWRKLELLEKFPNYIHYNLDIRNQIEISRIFDHYNDDIKLIIHAAAQPSHDLAAEIPIIDFTVNANGTLNLLEATRGYCKDTVFVFMSTNKVYGDNPNKLPFMEFDKRFEIDPSSLFKGIDESMSVDNCKHSLFGASKLAADVLVQEYGKYFGIKTTCLRGGCLTGGSHSGVELHGFLSYLMKCAIEEKEYFVFGYEGKQVRDNIHSYDLVNMIWHYYLRPTKGEVYNVGGSRFSNCSILEAIEMCEQITGNRMNITYVDDHRIGDHKWYISNIDKFRHDYPDWEFEYNLEKILLDIFDGIKGKQ